MAQHTGLSDTLTFAATRGRDWAPIIESDRRTDVLELDRTASRLAHELAAHGVASGDRVGIVVRNCASHLAALFGIWRVGAAAVPLGPGLAESERETLMAHAGVAVGLEVDPKSAEVAILPAPGARAIRVGEAPGGDAEAVVVYTSGTTGAPRGVILSHANLLESATAVSRTRRDNSAAIAAVLAPLSHGPIFVSHYLARLLTGGTVVLCSFDSTRIGSLVREHGVTDLPLVPAMVGSLLETDLSRLPSLAKVTVGSALTSMDVKRSLAERLPGIEILEAYGQTESTDGLTMTVGREALERPGTVGRPHAPITLAIGDAAPSRRDLAPGGEILVRGPTVMRGYLNDPEATRRALRDGWLHTGDIGRIDDDGFLYVTGRMKEIIISGGENVSPEEVEQVLRRHPALIEVAAFATAHHRWGEQVTVAVIAKRPVDVEELREFARPHLAAFKLPRALIQLRDFPRTRSGKVRRAELRRRYEEPS